jgi:hypothetical protein
MEVTNIKGDDHRVIYQCSWLKFSLLGLHAVLEAISASVFVYILSQEERAKRLDLPGSKQRLKKGGGENNLE